MWLSIQVKAGNKIQLSKLIDHTLLRPDATEADIVKLCDEAKQYGFFSVCIHPSFIETAKRILNKTNIKISTVIAFPHGMTLSRIKIFEAMEAVLNGADELDIVMNIGYAKTARWGEVERELADLITATPAAAHKIIIETCYLADNEKAMASAAAMNAGAEFIKTSTGFGPGGAVIEDVRLIRSVTMGKLGIKAAGGIRTLNDVMSFVSAGATRIGTTSGVSIMKETEQTRK